MKFTKTIILTSSFFLMFSLSNAGEKSIEKGNFLNINPNINNEELRSELELLIQDFDIEKQKIQDYYTKEIEQLKQERLSAVQAIKKKFGKRRETLLKKYRKDIKMKHSQPYKSNMPDKKVGKEKKSIRKPN